jgi:branched-subunit amino acid aminotransferase/4-amino-4-deoxychorismate lyase
VARAVLVNGQPADGGWVRIDADDEGLLLGRSVFETLRTYGRVVFGIEPHLDRLAASAGAMGIRVPDLDMVADEIIGAADAVSGEAVVRVTLTAGGVRIVRAADLPVVPSPFRCVTRHFVPPDWLDGTVKHSSRAFSRMAVLDAGVEEVLWVDGDGWLLEGTRSNIFVVQDGVFKTPPVDGRILAGVTRSALMDAAEEAGIPIELVAIRLDEACDEFYVSSTLKELTGVDQLNGEPAPSVGPIGTAVLASFRRMLADGLI